MHGFVVNRFGKVASYSRRTAMKRRLIVRAAALCGVALTCNESELVSPEVVSETLCGVR